VSDTAPQLVQVSDAKAFVKELGSLREQIAQLREMVDAAAAVFTDIRVVIVNSISVLTRALGAQAAPGSPAPVAGPEAPASAAPVEVKRGSAIVDRIREVERGSALAARIREVMRGRNAMRVQRIAALCFHSEDLVAACLDKFAGKHFARRKRGWWTLQEK
jgi:hypothetical protein